MSTPISTNPVELKVVGDAKPANITVSFGGVTTDPKLAQKTYDTVVAAINMKQITPSNSLQIVRKTMEVVAGIDGLTGPQKKTLVLDIALEVVNNADLDDAVKGLISTIITTVGPNTIDELILAGKRAFDFGFQELKSHGCLPCC